MDSNKIIFNEVIKVVMIAIKLLIQLVIQFFIFLPLQTWKDSSMWVSNHADGSFCKESGESGMRVLPIIEGALNIVIYMSWVIGVIVTLISAVIVGSGWGGFGGFVTTLISGLIITYLTPLGYALMREIVSILIKAAR